MNTILKRDWNSLAPKLVAFLATGLSATAIITVGQYFGILIPQGLAAVIVVVIGTIAGYIKSDVIVATPEAPLGNPSVPVATNVVAAPTNVTISTVAPAETVTPPTA